MNLPPAYDDNGLHVVDPNDPKGLKTEYITLLHEIALLKYLPEAQGGIAVDVGCGYGRLTSVLRRKNWKSIGIEPSKKLLEYAKTHYPENEFLCGSLPELPIPKNYVGLLLLQNLLRVLHLCNAMHVIRGIGEYVNAEGYLVVVDNIRDGHSAYLSESEIIQLVESEGFQLEQRIPIRAARWWMIYLIRYGLIPRRWFPKIAQWELQRMAHRFSRPRWQYYNIMFIFRKKT